MKKTARSTTDNAGLRTAVAAWQTDPAAAAAEYGDIASWDTSLVTDMAELFCAENSDGNCYCGTHGCHPNARLFNGDLAGWNTAGVTDMRDMFRFSVSFTSDLSSWDVAAVNDICGGCSGVPPPSPPTCRAGTSLP